MAGSRFLIHLPHGIKHHTKNVRKKNTKGLFSNSQSQFETREVTTPEGLVSSSPSCRVQLRGPPGPWAAQGAQSCFSQHFAQLRLESHGKEELPDVNSFLTQLFGGAKHWQSTATNPSTPNHPGTRSAGHPLRISGLHRSTHTRTEWKEL